MERPFVVAENRLVGALFPVIRRVYSLIAPLRAVVLLVSRESQGGAPKRYEHFMNILPTQATQWGLCSRLLWDFVGSCSFNVGKMLVTQR